MTPVLEDRWTKLATLSLKKGSHSADSEMCVMEAVAFVAGEPWTDSPVCACPVISAFLRNWNDSLRSDAERDRLLKPLIPRLVDTKGSKELEERRSLMAADWLVRVNTPAWLRLAGLTVHADALVALPEITSMKQVPSLRGPLEAARQDATAARDAARAAAWAAARAAAWDATWDVTWAAAWAAAWDATWAAARDAAWDAARDAARAAAWAAAWAAARDATRAAARAKLQPVVEELQQSALKLVERMIEAKVEGA